MKGGTLLMYGIKGVPARGGVSWTTLAAPAGSNVPGAKVKSTGLKTLKLSDDVTKGTEGWAAGDWIVVATTSYSPFESEFVQIASVTSGGKSGGSTVTLKQPLKYYHFGSLPPSPATETCPAPFGLGKDQPAFLCDGADRNWGVDERAEVGLVSRDIELTAETEAVTTVPPPATSSLHWGGEIMIHSGFAQVAIQGVRLSKFGKDQLGSYPIHFHMIGSIGKGQPALIDADSVDHSYNKCVTIHNTSNTISNMVCARIVGHIFYQELDPVAEASDAGIVYQHDLGLGAMSNSFDIYPVTVGGKKIPRQQMIDQYWWAGDYMTNAQCATGQTCIGYDDFNIPDTDNVKQSTHGACYDLPGANSGKWQGGTPPPCSPTQYYIEPASGFWIQNPGTVLADNSIAGCQGDGVAYWWVTPESSVIVGGNKIDLRLNPLGEVRDDHASVCYHAYFAENENNVTAGQLSPIKNGEGKSFADSPNIITHFSGLTAAHNRWRALWLRGAANWYVVKNGHFGDNNRGATLLTSGGIDGNGPGVWELLEDSVFVGMSQNNVGRWEPCPKTDMLGKNTGFQYGCIDYSYPPTGTAHSGEVDGKGYPWPYQNSYGYQIYDGPALIFHNRFVNYNYNTDKDSATNCNGPKVSPDPTACAFSYELTAADRKALYDWQQNNSTGYNRYEGDDAVPDGNGGTFHPSMLMETGRNGLGIWEPKVTNGYGYTVMVKPATTPPAPPDLNSHKAGIWKWIEVGVADVVDPNISAGHPFFIQLGINYTNTDGSHPANNFTITRGYKSYYGGVFWHGDPELVKYWTELPCFNLDVQNVNNIPWSGNNNKPNCPAGTTTTLTKVASISGLTKPDGTPNLGVYYYNQATGYLYLNVAQDEPRRLAPRPPEAATAHMMAATPTPPVLT